MTKPHVFASNPLDRGERERRDEDWISQKAVDPESKFLAMSGSNVLITKASQPELGWIGIDDLRAMGVDAEPFFLGLRDGTAYFTIDVSKSDGAVSQLNDDSGRRFQEARAAAEQLSGPDAGIMAQARAQINWHSRHGFCSVCGHKTTTMRGGHMRKCPECQTQHFPRTDPVIIMVVSDSENDRCLLGQSRGRLSRMRMYSALAGFMDQAETIEEAVAREVMEEAGISIRDVRYHSSQPWPFPSSLMIGCHAEAVTTDIHMDPEEMSDVQWFDRDEVLLALEGRSSKLAVPGRIAIAHHLIKAWATNSLA